MYHNWVEMRAYMLEHQRDLVSLADRARAQAGDRRGSAFRALVAACCSVLPRLLHAQSGKALQHPLGIPGDQHKV